MAYDGRPVLLDDIKPQNLNIPNPARVSVESKHLRYEPLQTVDYHELMGINKEIQDLLLRLHQVRQELAVAERAIIRTRIAYDQALRRELIKTTGGTEKTRQAWAEMLCEELYTEHAVAVQVAKEIQQISRDTRVQLDGLRELSNNIRRQADIDLRN